MASAVRPLRARSVDFATGASRATDLPPARGPEVALAGRSNVGKSSLLNRLVRRPGIARVSKTPGRTQQINFFDIDGTWRLVDLPGYGFARVPIQIRDSWRALVEAYLKRAALRGVVVLVDLRRGLQAEDAQLLAFLAQRGVATCVAATKADKLGRGERRQHVDALRADCGGVDLVVSSATTGEGISDLEAVIRGWLEAAP